MDSYKKHKRVRAAYAENELLLGLNMIDKLSRITELLLYFLDKKNIKFTYILMHIDDEDFESFLRAQKRATDILIPVDEKDQIFAIVCQETDVEGGYRFAERIIRLLEVDRRKKCLSCNVLTVSTMHYAAQEIVMNLLERYLDFKKEGIQRSLCKIDFYTLS